MMAILSSAVTTKCSPRALSVKWMRGERDLEARGGIEPPIMVLQTIALPLGDRATEPKEI